VKRIAGQGLMHYYNCSEEDLTESLEEAMEKYPDTYAVLVRRHGM
jgi:hypothetical protein